MSMAASKATRLHLEVTKPSATTPQALFWVRFTASRNGFCCGRKAGDTAGSLSTHGVTLGLPCAGISAGLHGPCGSLPAQETP